MVDTLGRGQIYVQARADIANTIGKLSWNARIVNAVPGPVRRYPHTGAAREGIRGTHVQTSKHLAKSSSIIIFLHKIRAAYDSADELTANSRTCVDA